MCRFFGRVKLVGTVEYVRECKERRKKMGWEHGELRCVVVWCGKLEGGLCVHIDPRVTPVGSYDDERVFEDLWHVVHVELFANSRMCRR